MRRLAAIAAAVLVLTMASACGGNDANSGDTSSNGTTQSAGNGPDQSDSRKLADWAALQMAKGNTTAICKYDSQLGLVHKYFENDGWCSKTPTPTPAVPTKVQLKGECDGRVVDAVDAPGKYRFYKLDPSAQYDPSKGKVNQIEVAVDKQNGKYVITGLYVNSQDVTDESGKPNFLNVNGCQGQSGATAVDADPIKVS